MNAETVQRPTWEIDQVLSSLIGQEIRVAAVSFCPESPNRSGHHPWIRNNELVAPDGFQARGAPVYFEGKLIRFSRRIGVVHVVLDELVDTAGVSEGLIVFRSSTAVFLKGPATVELASPFKVEKLPRGRSNFRITGSSFDISTRTVPFVLNFDGDRPRAGVIVKAWWSPYVTKPEQPWFYELRGAEYSIMPLVFQTIIYHHMDPGDVKTDAIVVPESSVVAFAGGYIHLTVDFDEEFAEADHANNVFTSPILRRNVIGFDANRDGAFDLDGDTDKTSSAKPHVFWLNNDSDPSAANEDAETDEEPSDHVDSEDDIIQSARDTEDLSAIRIRLPRYLDVAREKGLGFCILEPLEVGTAFPLVRIWKALGHDREDLSQSHIAHLQASVDAPMYGFPPATTPLLFDYDESHPRPRKSGKNVVFMDHHVSPLKVSAPLIRGCLGLKPSTPGH